MADGGMGAGTNFASLRPMVAPRSVAVTCACMSSRCSGGAVRASADRSTTAVVPSTGTAGGSLRRVVPTGKAVETASASQADRSPVESSSLTSRVAVACRCGNHRVSGTSARPSGERCCSWKAPYCWSKKLRLTTTSSGSGWSGPSLRSRRLPGGSDPRTSISLR